MQHQVVALSARWKLGRPLALPVYLRLQLHHEVEVRQQSRLGVCRWLQGLVRIVNALHDLLSQLLNLLFVVERVVALLDFFLIVFKILSLSHLQQSVYGKRDVVMRALIT